MKEVATALALLISCIGLTTAQGITATVATADEFTTAVWNTSVSTITVLKDMKFADVLLQRWVPLADNYVLTRNLTIMGLPGSFPALDLNYWRTEPSLPLNYTGKPNIKGIMVGTGVTLTFKRITFKRASQLVPAMVAGGQDPSTSYAYIEDCIMHRYAFVGSPGNVATVWIGTPRPAWAGPYPNYYAVLPEGYCRTAPDPAKCWQYSFMIWDSAGDWSGSAVIRTVIRSTAAVAEILSPGECFDQFLNHGNATCLIVTANALAQQEKQEGVFWLGPPPTQQEIDKAAAGLVEAQLEYAQMLADRDNPEANNSKRAHIGIAVGVSIGGLSLLLAVAVLIHRRRLWSRCTKQDIEANHSKSQNYVTKTDTGSTDDIPKLPDPMQPIATLAFSSTTPSSLNCDEYGNPVSTGSGSGLTPASDQDTQSGSQVGFKQKDLRNEASNIQPGVEGEFDNHSAVVQAKDGVHVVATVLPVRHTNVLLVDDASGAICSKAQVQANSEPPVSKLDVTDAMRLDEVVTPDTIIPTTLVTDVQLGTDITLGRKIGSGAMGTVYEATFRDTPVAVKLLSPGADLKSFEHELGILARTRHPNVIRLLAANLTSSSQPLLVEELAHGSLEELLYPPHPNPGPNPTTSHITPGSLPVLPTPLSMSVVLSLALDIASGLAYLHPTILHRDLKPGNVLLLCASHSDVIGSKHGSPPVSRDTADVADGDSREKIGSADTADKPQAMRQLGGCAANDTCHALHAKISDFGLSRMHDAMTIVTDKPHCGTLPYMAPECFSRERPAGLTHKCDIYSFGILLWEMLHGTRPWDGCTPVQVVYEVVINKTRPPITTGETRCPRQVRKLIMRCWDADPDRRPPALEVARELAFIQRQLGFVNVMAAGGTVL